jgi:sec-independent protein translocase protein TatB
MFGMGWPEMLVIAMVAALMVGPDKMPALARTAVMWIRFARRTVQGIATDLSREIGSALPADLADLNPRNILRQAIEDE